MTTQYWCELAWLGGHRASSRGRHRCRGRSHSLGRLRTRRAPSRCHRATGTYASGTGQRPQPCVSPGSTRPYARRQGNVLDMARADVPGGRQPRSRQLLPTRPGNLRRDGSGRASGSWASSTTSTTGPEGILMTIRTPSGRAWWPRRVMPEIRLTLLDTLYLHGGFAPGSGSGYAPPASRTGPVYGDGSV